MKILLAYSSKTGNTKKLSDGIYDSLVKDYEIDLSPIDKVEAFDEYQLIIAGFWVDKGTANSEAKKFIKKIRDKDIMLIGTLGAAPESEHGQKVLKTVAKLPHRSNRYLGAFLSHGKVDPVLTERIQSLPLPKKLKDKMYESSINSREPNDEDIKNGIDFVLGAIEN